MTTAAAPCPWYAVNTHVPLGTDTHANYWVTPLTADPSVTLTVTGTYPAARYASLQAYTAPGAFLAGLADKDFPPDPGSTNPFAAGGLRGIGAYTLHVVFAPTPAQPAPGTLYVAAPAGAVIVLLYRIYLPDTTATPTGNVPLPVVTAETADGSPVPCPQAAATAQTLLRTAAHSAASWLSRRESIGSPSTATPPGFIRPNPGGVYTNIDAAYHATALFPAPLYVIRFQAPTTPHTLAGGPLDPTTQLRYWSLCIYTWQALPIQCLADEQVPLGATGQVTMVLGPWWARPANATAANGVTWVSLNWFVLPYFVVLRQMLPAATFGQSAFAVPSGAAPAAAMGPYAPTVVACDTARFQLNECGS